jgi:ubiquinone/menaquinone biosynthesis C-methylase UbiE
MDSSIDIYNNAAAAYAESRIGTEDKAGLEKLRLMLKMDDRVLDVGCAAGRDTRILKDMGFNAIGSDLSEKLLEIARNQNPDIEFVLADMMELPFDDGTFNVVWASAVLHHVSKDTMPKVLKEFNRVLADEGILYLHTKAGEGKLRSKEDTVLGGEREFELVTADEIDAMLLGSGFKKISLEQKASKSRPGLQWLIAFYKKQ